MEVLYPLVICYIAIENGDLVRGFTMENGDVPSFFCLPEGTPIAGWFISCKIIHKKWMRIGGTRMDGNLQMASVFIHNPLHN